MRTESLERPHEAFLNIGLMLAGKMAYYTLYALDKTHQTLDNRFEQYEQQGFGSVSQYAQDFTNPKHHPQYENHQAEEINENSLKKLFSAALIPAGVALGVGAIGLMLGASVLGAGAAGILKSATNRFGNQIDDIQKY